MELEDIIGFKSSSKISEELNKYGIVKTFKEGDIILKENAYIKSIPIVIKGAIRVMQTDDEEREILLYYIQA